MGCSSLRSFRPTGLLVVFLFETGCVLLTPLDGFSEPTTDAAIVDGDATIESGPSASADALESSDDTASDDAAVDSESGSATACEAGSCVYTSCKEIKSADANAATGAYVIRLRGESVTVHCEMSIDGGGWTLIARSAPGGSGPFGWTFSAGTAAGSSAYSLGTNGLAFRQVLVGNYVTANVLADRVYRFDVPQDFPSVHPTSGLDVSSSLATIRGSCSASELGMLANWGYAAMDGVFWSRDLESFEYAWGLQPDGFDLIYTSCRSGFLEGSQGLIFVR